MCCSEHGKCFLSFDSNEKKSVIQEGCQDHLISLLGCCRLWALNPVLSPMTSLAKA